VKILSQQIYGRIMNYRIGPKTQMSNECLIDFSNLDSATKAGNFVGRRVVWKSGKSELFGRIIGFHGKNGVVKVKFTKGVPGQAIGTIVKLVA
jgi:large subunit ribosomal protein L35Ae